MAERTEPRDKPAEPMSWWGMLKATFHEWSEDRASRLAAAFAYYAIFSIGPILIITVAIVGAVFGEEAAQDQLRPQIAEAVGDQAASFVQEMIEKAAFSPSLSFAGILSAGLLLYAATNLFASLQDALNTIFDVEPKPGRGVWGIVSDRALGFGMVLLIGALLFAATVASTFLPGFAEERPVWLTVVLHIAAIIVSTLIFTVAFAMIFKYLPDIRIRWRDTLIGAALTAFVFTLAKFGLSWYLTHSSTAGPFGAAGSLVIIMIFIYYTSQIMFFGAEFTQIYAKRNGKAIEPSSNAVSLDPQYTHETEQSGTGEPDNASGATGSRKHYDKAAKRNPGDGAGVARGRPSYSAGKYHPPMS